LGINGKIHDLLRWAGDDEAQEEYFALLSMHPRFVEAARAMSRNLLAQAASDPAFDGLHKDAGRFIAGCWAMSLHLSGGLTLPRLKETCARAGIMSPGRARSLLQFFLFLRYIEALPATARGAPIRYAPTQAMMESWGAMVRAGLAAAIIVEPAVSAVVARLDEPGVLARFMAYLGSSYLPSVLGKPYQTFMRTFLEPHAGVQLVDLMVTATADQDAFPPVRPIPISINATAQRLRVSRAHIRRILDRGQDEGLLTRQRDGTIQLSEAMRSTIRYLEALRLYGFLVCAARTHAATQ
jgi:DNA-binding Lrp family transcriptional regulator